MLEQMLEQIDAPYAWLREVLLCVAFAKRPLTVNELAGSMWMAPSSSNILVSGQPTLQKMLIAAPAQLKRDLELACSPLLHVDNGVVRIVHGILRDFIRKRSCALLQNEVPHDGHMLQKCLHMLSIPELWKMDSSFFKRRPFDTLCEPSTVLQPHIFTLYAGSCLSIHMREDAEDDAAASVIKDSTAAFLDNQDAKDWWTRTFTTQLAAASEIAEDNRKMVEHFDFQQAASMGAWAMLELMMPEVSHDADKIELALWNALRQGHTRATRLLLSKAGSSNRDIWLESIQKCCSYGCADLMSLVLSCWSESLGSKLSEDDVQGCLDIVAEHGHWNAISRFD